ncbi:tungstate transport system permease protein [Propionispira arboris]|uniref:Tungstate transport system permease protein n=1 Tax=Propionispira arboris TaxID=84035 RepID=A0A1H6Y0Z2_9FIRM|nr:ABC transporter permease [Propionispira arboris]SEJ30475.1 tungstate transport system permease protein [Propionispira arboris]
MEMQAFWEALQFVVTGNDEVWAIAWLTIQVSGIATLISVAIGLPFGIWLALTDFPGKKLIYSFINYGMGFPPVVAGLMISLLLWRYGPLGNLSLMYTPTAMILAQTMIAMPIIIGFSFTAIMSVNPLLRYQFLSLGAKKWQADWLLIKEARLGLLAAVIAGFGRVSAEVGASMMVGGNIKGQTRVLTTATVMEVGKGNYEMALAISAVLLMIAYSVVLLLTYLQHERKREIR